MSGNSQCPLFKKAFETPNDGLSIEIAIEVLVETSLEVEEKENHFASL